MDMSKKAIEKMLVDLGEDEFGDQMMYGDDSENGLKLMAALLEDEGRYM